MTEMSFGSFDDEYKDSPPPPAAIPAIGAGASLVSMQIDEYRLPVRIDLDPRWTNTFSPHEYGASILSGYQLAMLRHNQDAFESGQLNRLTLRPSRRTQLLALLETSIWEEADDVRGTFSNRRIYEAFGAALDRADEPAVRVKADPSSLTSVWIDSGWGATASPYAIADDVLRCVDQIRSMRPRFDFEGSPFADLSEDELTQRYRAHMVELLQEKVARS